MQIDSDQTQGGPLTETERKRLAAKRSAAMNNYNRGNIRFIRPLIALIIGGLVFILGGVMSWNDDDSFEHSSWAYQNLGPRGIACVGILIGVAMLTGSYLLMRKIHRARNAFEAQQTY